MERDGRHLEAESDEHERQAGQQQTVLEQHVRPQEVLDLHEVRGARGSVGKRHSVQEKRGREAAEHEVLERRLLRLQASGMAAREDVQRDRERLESEEQHDEIVRRRHHDAADGGEQQEGVDLTAIEVFTAEGVVGDEGREENRTRDRDSEEDREPVEPQRATRERAGSVLADVVPQKEPDRDRRQRDDTREDRVGAAWEQFRAEHGTDHEDEGPTE